MALGRPRAEASLAGTGIVKDLAKEDPVLANSVDNPALGPKLNPNPNQKQLPPSHPTPREPEGRVPPGSVRTDPPPSYATLTVPSQEDRRGGWVSTAQSPRRQQPSGRATARKLHVELEVGALVGTPPTRAFSLDKGAPLYWDPLEAVCRDQNSTPGKMIAATASNRRRII